MVYDDFCGTLQKSTVFSPLMSAQESTEKLQAAAKGYRFVNICVLLFCAWIFLFFILTLAFLPSRDTSAASLLFAFPLFFAVVNIALIITTAYLGTKVMDIGWIGALLLSFFGSFITAIIFARLAATQLKQNGYKVGLINARLMP